MRFVYTDHMRYQMFNRNISESQVESAVSKPDELVKDARDPRLTVAVREFTPGTVLKVWYRLEPGTAAVVSCILVTTRRENPERAARKNSQRNNR